MWAPQAPVSTWRSLWGPWSCPARGPSPPTTLVIAGTGNHQGAPSGPEGKGRREAPVELGCRWPGFEGSGARRERKGGSERTRPGSEGQGPPHLPVPLSKGCPMTHLRWRPSGALRSCLSVAAAWRRPRSTASVREQGTSAWPLRAWTARWACGLLGEVRGLQPPRRQPHAAFPPTAVRLQCRHPQTGDHEAVQPRGAHGAL